MQGLLLLSLLSMVFANEHDVAQKTSLSSEDETVIRGPTSCTLPCTVMYKGSEKLMNVGYLRVNWEAKLNSHLQREFQSLSYWSKNGIAQFGSHFPTCRRLPSNDTGQLVADCSLKVDGCSSKPEQAEDFEGNYRCQVFHTITGFKTSFNSKLEIRRLDGDPSGTIGDSGLGCYVPEAKEIMPKIFIDSYNVSRLNVTWVSTVKPQGDVYCDGTRRWYVRVLKYESVTDVFDEDIPDSDELTIFQPTSLPRETHFEWNEPLNREKYYVIQVQNKVPTSRSLPTTKDVTYTSYIYYFGEQTEPYFKTIGEEVMVVDRGDTVNIVCDAGGLPQPQISILYQDTRIDLEGSTFQLRDANEMNVGIYYCLASNYRVNPPEGRRRLTATKKITIRLQALNSPEERLCVQYTGSICRTYLFSDMSVFTNASVESLEPTVQMHSGSIAYFTSLHKGNLDSLAYQAAGITAESVDTCQAFLKAMACHVVLPYCDALSHEPRPVCRHSCQVMRDGGACGFFLDPDLLREDAFQVKQLRDTLMASCDTRINPAGTSPECIYVSYQSPATDGHGDLIKQSMCVKGNGRGYIGQDNVHTESGIPCQSWASQTPNRHTITPSHFSLELLNARFACRNPGGLGERPWCFTADTQSGKRWEYCNVPQCEVCETYGGSFCSALPGYGDRSVYMDWEDWTRPDMGEMERNMVGLYHSMKGDTLSPGCRYALRLLICHGSLPFCKSEGSAAPLKSCRDHCKLFEEMTTHCPSDVTQELQSHWLSIGTETRLYPPDCSLGVEQAEECMPSPQRLVAVVQAEAGNECYNSSDRGQSYNGSVSETLRGSQCMPWVDTNTSVELYPELSGADRGCRNPGQWRETPWCVTISGDVELCGIDLCEPDDSVVDDRSPGGQEGFDSSKVTGPVVVVVIGIPVVLVVMAIIGGLIYHIKKKQNTALGNSPPQLTMIPSTNDNLKNMKFRENNQYNMVSLEQSLPSRLVETIISFHQIPQDRIEYVKQLGQGFFGMVFKGKLKPAYSGDEETLVAVKTLKEDNNDSIEAFVNEAKLMFGFDNEHIVKILGVSMTRTPYYLVFEYMDKGDLCKFLRENASSLQRRYMNPTDRPRSRTESTLSDDPATLNPEQLSDICKQIASGMEYLSSLKYVHRDLACRNCLVKSVPEGDSSTPSRVIVKIGDFGLSHNLYSRDYYRVRGQAVLPIRWMSPEAIIYGKFSTAGDVWSFGVVMWEIFSFGMQPYYGISNEEVMERVRHGRVLAKPADCSTRMYTIMTECWQKCESERPGFTEILMYLDGCRGSVSSDDAQSVYSDISSDAFLEENSDPETECVGGP